MLRAKWTGTLKFGLVTVPVKLYTATESQATIKFNQIHSCGKRLKQGAMRCETCNVDVPRDQILRGFAVGKDQYVTIADDELATVMVEASKTIDIREVVPVADISALMIESSDFIAPDGPAAYESFVTMRAALKNRCAIGTFVNRGREDLVAVQAHDTGMVLHHLHYKTEMRDINSIADLAHLPKPQPAALKLADSLLAHFESRLNHDTYVDTYATGVKAMAVAKAGGKKIAAAAPAAAAPAPSSLMAALQASLDQAPKKPAKRKVS